MRHKAYQQRIQGTNTVIEKMVVDYIAESYDFLVNYPNHIPIQHEIERIDLAMPYFKKWLGKENDKCLRVLLWCMGLTSLLPLPEFLHFATHRSLILLYFFPPLL